MPRHPFELCQKLGTLMGLSSMLGYLIEFTLRIFK